MAGNFLNVGVSGLLSHQSALNTVSHNIANANTEGYSRQITEIDARSPQFLGGNFLGTGAEVASIRRVFDESTALELQANLSGFGELEAYLEQASRIDNLVADSSTNLNGALQNFFSAVQAVADEPTSIGARQVLVSRGELLAGRFNTIVEQLDSQASSLNSAISASADEISTLGQEIANLNVKIAAASGGGQGEANDLLDQRNRLLNDLSELVDIKTLKQDDGSINVFVGNGQALVVGATANRVVAQPSSSDQRTLELRLQAGASSVNITDNITSGKLGGLLRFRTDILQPAYNTVGRVALAVSETVNSQHNLGMDLNDELGGDFFTAINDPTLMARRVVNDTGNTGTADISLQIDDVNQLNDANYDIAVQGGNYIITDLTTGTSITRTPTGANPETISLDSPAPGLGSGLSIVINSGTAANGDRFSLFPTRSAGADIGMQISDPTQIAAALPVTASFSASNIGTGNVANVQVTDTSNAAFSNAPNSLNPPLQIQFTSATTFDVIDPTGPATLATGVAYTPNQNNDVLSAAGLNFGYEVTLNGAPQVGDTFNINYNAGGVGDNRNILDLGDLQQLSTLDNGNSNFQQGFGRLVSQVGTRTQEAQIGREAQQSLLNQVKERRESISGVNLDEEAAKLIKFEQAYQASAQVIQVARTIFQTIIDSTR